MTRILSCLAGLVALTFGLAACGGDSGRQGSPSSETARSIVAMIMEYGGSPYAPVDYRSPYLDASFDVGGFQLVAGDATVTVEGRSAVYTVDVYAHAELEGLWTRDPAVDAPTAETLWIRWDPAAQDNL